MDAGAPVQSRHCPVHRSAPRCAPTGEIIFTSGRSRDAGHRHGVSLLLRVTWNSPSVSSRVGFHDAGSRLAIQDGRRERVARGKKLHVPNLIRFDGHAPGSGRNYASIRTFLAATPFSVCWLSAGCNCCTTVIVSRVRRCNLYARSRRSLSWWIRIVWFI